LTPKKYDLQMMTKSLSNVKQNWDERLLRGCEIVISWDEWTNLRYGVRANRSPVIGLARIFHILATRTTSFSLTPCFSCVVKCLDLVNRFNGSPQPTETVETVPTSPGAISTQLKQGVNEMGFSASSFDFEISGPGSSH
jgi:hypothetical protein